MSFLLPFSVTYSKIVISCYQELLSFWLRDLIEERGETFCKGLDLNLWLQASNLYPVGPSEEQFMLYYSAKLWKSILSDQVIVQKCMNWCLVLNGHAHIQVKCVQRVEFGEKEVVKSNTLRMPPMLFHNG